MRYVFLVVNKVPNRLLLFILRVLPNSFYVIWIRWGLGFLFCGETPTSYRSLHPSSEGVIFASCDRKYWARMLPESQITWWRWVVGLRNIPYLNKPVLWNWCEDGFGWMEMQVSDSIVMASQSNIVFVQNWSLNDGFSLLIWHHLNFFPTVIATATRSLAVLALTCQERRQQPPFLSLRKYPEPQGM